MVEGWGSVCLASVFTVETRSFWAPGHLTWNTSSSPVFSADDSRLWWTRRLLMWLLMCWTAWLTMLPSRWADIRGSGWSRLEHLRPSRVAWWHRPAQLSWSLPLLSPPAQTVAVHHPERSRGGVNIINQPSKSLHHHYESHQLSS